jgi:hypothetical protein
MIIKTLIARIPRQLCFTVLIYGCFFGLAGLANGQINVTNFGAKGDLLILNNCITTSNSTSVTCPSASWSSATDIGKAVLLFGCGAYQGVSNQDLYVYISSVVSSTSITISHPAQATLTNALCYYGTQDYSPFTNAIAKVPAPTGTIIVPPGDYFILPPGAFATNGYSNSLSFTLMINRGGITFAGQGTAILTGMGGWVYSKVLSGNGYRSALFAMSMPMTNNYPLIFTNLTFDGGVLVGNIHNLGWPPNPNTGLGWDGTHHWMVALGGSGSIINSLQTYNCTMRHWRGEMMEDTSGSANLYYTASNCFFYDGDGSMINNFGHNVVDCTFSNANQVEEFYRTYNTNISFMSGCTIEGMSGTTCLAVNGGTVNNPYYTINNCSFSNYNGAALLLLPGTDINFVSNYVDTAIGIGPDDNGFQGGAGVSNIFVAWNTGGPGCQSLFFSYNSFYGASNWIPQNIYVFSNYWPNASALVGGYGYTSNVFVFNNTGGGGGVSNWQIKGQYPFEETNNNLANFTQSGAGTGNATLVSFSNACFAKITGGVSGSVFVLDNSSPWQIPPAAVMIVTNPTTLSFAIYPTTNTTGTPITLGAKTSDSFLWNGSEWVYGGNGQAQGAPIMEVTPGSQSYGTVMNGTSVTNSLTVENVGGGTLSGTASVAAPFSILSGGSYSLGNNQSQAISVVFNPATAGSYSQDLTFTANAGNASSVLVSGTGTNITSGVAPTLSAISANVANQGTNAALLSVNSGPVQLSASASANNNDPLSWQWWYYVNRGGQTVYQRGSGSTPTMVFTNSVNAGGNTNVWTLQITDTKNGLTAQSQLSIYVMVSPPQSMQVIP